MKQREVLKVKVGDIVYFKESHIANYVQGQYHFLPDVPYIVIKAPGSGICTIKAPDGTEHFIYSTREYGDPYGKLISSREKNLEKLGLDEFSSKVQKLFDWWDCVSQYEQWNVYGDWIHHKVKLRLSGNVPNLEAYINSMKDEIKFDRGLYREKKLRKLGI